MKILQLTSKVPWPPKDGEAIAVLTLSKGFFLHGHQVTVLALNAGEDHNAGAEEIPEFLAAEIDFRLVDIPAQKDRYMSLSKWLFPDLPMHAHLMPDDRYNRALIRLLTEQKFDVIQLEGLYLCPYLPIIRKYSNALVAYRVHNIEYEVWKRTAKKGGLWRYLYLGRHVSRLKKFEKSILNRYDVLVTITERDGITFDRMGNRKPRYTSQTGIDLSALVPTAKDLEYPSLFHIGALNWPPNQEGLVWFLSLCWPAIHKKYPYLNFYVAGRNAPGWIKSRYAGDQVIFLGEVEDACQFMNSKAIMVVPLHSGSGMRIKIIEGMALGKAIVCTTEACEGIPAIDRENILIADTPEAFSSAIDELLTDRLFFDRLCKNSVDLIREKFDNLSIVGALVNFYQCEISASASVEKKFAADTDRVQEV